MSQWVDSGVSSLWAGVSLGFPLGAWWVSGGFPTVGRGFLGISFRCLAGLRGFSYFRALFAFILFVFDFFVGFLVCFCLFCFFVCFLCQSVVCVVFFFIRFWVVVSLLSLFLFSVIHLVCGLPTSC